MIMAATDEETIVIVGAGIAGLTTALGLHRLGIRSLVLESSERLRATGFSFGTWPNAWRALDAVGVGDSLRREHQKIVGLKTFSAISGKETGQREFRGAVGGTQEEFELRSVKRLRLLETMEAELPKDTIRYSSKVVSIEDSGYPIRVHLADGSILKAKVLIGCDGVNSRVAQWLGFKKPAFTGRIAIRGSLDYDHGHEFGATSVQGFGEGVRFGFVPCNQTTVYWFFSWSPSPQDEAIDDNPEKMKQLVLARLGKVPDQVREAIEKTKLENLVLSPLRYRYPWELLWGNISKGTVCVAGDAFHPMTPDIAQGACAAMEDAIVLARCLCQALLNNSSRLTAEGEERKRIEAGLKKYAGERRWRAAKIVATAFMVGYIQQSNGKVLTFLRDRVLAAYLAGQLAKMTSFNCGDLTSTT